MKVGPSLRRGLIVGGVAGIVLVALAGAGTVLLRSHHAPGPLGLSSPAPEASQNSADGLWTVGQGSEVGYRVKEQFINQPGPTEAVARTPKVTGGLQIVGSGSSFQATRLHFTADLATLQSQDKYANYNVWQRDFFIRTIYLQTGRYPNAEFIADAVAIPAGITSGPISISVPGRLTVHGVTKPATAAFQAQLSGSNVEVAGSMTVDMRDFGIEVPDISFTTAQPMVVIEFHLVLVHSSSRG
jgi:polyisoprenoid-binding protein YceI